MTIPTDPLASIQARLKELDAETKHCEDLRSYHLGEISRINLTLDRLDTAHQKYIDAAELLKSAAVRPPEHVTV